MRITEVYLKDIKSYQETTVRFPSGTIAISGPNGAGKSTILESIGFALFDYLPYRNQREFMRHNALEAEVRVTFLSRLDECAYQVVRTLKRAGGGSGSVSSTYFVYSFDRQDRVAEQKQDVQGFLRAHIGLDDYADLGRVFADVLGVPQGRLTADFLLTPSQRKDTFDPLLRVDAYRRVFEKLRDVTDVLKGNVTALELRVSALEPEAARLPEARAALAEFAEHHTKSAAQARHLTGTLERLQEDLRNLEHQRRTLDQHQNLVEQLTQHQQHLHNRVKIEQGQVDLARGALKRLNEAAEGHSAYLRAQEALAALEEERNTAESLQNSKNKASNALIALQTRQEALERGVEEARDAAALRASLEPQVARQERLEAHVQEFGVHFQYARQYGESVTSVLGQLAASESNGHLGLAAVDLPAEPNETAACARARLAEQHEQLQAMGLWLEQQADLRQRRSRLQTDHKETAQAVAHSESFAAAASKLETLELQLQSVRDKVSAFAAQRRFNQESKEMAADGLCPFFKDFCPKVEEGHSLTPVLTGLIRDYADQAEQAQAEKQQLEHEIAQAKEARQHVERLQVLVPRLHQLQDELKASEEQEQAVEQRIVECLRGVWPAQTVAAILTRLEEEERTLRNELAELGNPRQTADRLFGPANELEQRSALLAEVSRERDLAAKKLAGFTQRLEPYADLPQRVASQRGTAEANLEDYRTYLQNQEVAADLPRREEAAAALAVELKENSLAVAEAQRLRDECEAAWDPDALTDAQAAVNQTQSRLGAANERIRYLQEQIRRSSDEVAELELAAKALEDSRNHLDEAQEVYSVTGFLRNVIRDAGPQVARYLIQQISAEANTLFSEIMGDAAAELSLTEDYEIRLEQHGHRRGFMQLSGGEQMSAALAVRLGLLRQLSDLDIAFFDEPTQNMDRQRRHNLAEQLQRVTGFHQLFVISHDDTFEPMVSSVLRVRKENGVSTVENE